MENNPQFLITVSKKCNIFVSMAQKDALDTFRGFNFKYKLIKKGQNFNKSIK